VPVAAAAAVVAAAAAAAAVVAAEMAVGTAVGTAPSARTEAVDTIVRKFKKPKLPVKEMPSCRPTWATTAARRIDSLCCIGWRKSNGTMVSTVSIKLRREK
jgi:hypothetical protein